MKKSLLSLFPSCLLLLFLQPNEVVIGQENNISLSSSKTVRNATINRLQLKSILKNKRDKFFIARNYIGDSIHDDLRNSLPFRPNEKINITDWIVKNYDANNKYIRIYLKNNRAKTDSIVYTINLKKLRHRKRQKDCPEFGDACCDSCLEVNSRTFVMDMCNKEVCMNTRRPMLISSGRCVANNELKIGCDQLLSFAITNNNPLKYELEINHKDVSFNTDHTSFDAAMARLNPVQTNTPNLKPEPDPHENLDMKKLVINIDTLLMVFEANLDTLQKLINEVQSYLELKSAESCLNESEIKQYALQFLHRYNNAFGVEGPEARLKKDSLNIKSAESTQTLTPKQKKALDRVMNKSIRLVPDGIKQLKNLIGKLLNVSTTYALLPIQVNEDDADVIEITVKRKNILTKVSDQYKYDFRVKGGVKIDFSAGAFLSLLRDEKYTTKDRRDTLIGFSGSDSIVIKRIIQSQKSDNFSYMFGSLMHVYLRNGNYVNGSINLGAAVNTQQRAVLLTGVSLILGRQQRFCINGGLAFATVKRLASPYNVGDVYEASGDVPLIDQYLAGWAFGFTYNLSKTKVVTNTSN